MLAAYRDILDAAGCQPDWWTDQGVRRFAPFAPTMLGVYDQFALLAEMACQSCDQRFLIGEGWTRFEVTASEVQTHTLIELVAAWSFGDPPRHDDGQRRCAGAAMCSVQLRVVEAWEREDLEWVRRPELARLGAPGRD